MPYGYGKSHYIDPIDAAVCMECDRTFHCEYSVLCEGCEGEICEECARGCVETCEICDAIFCNECITNPECGCRVVVCDRCVNSHLKECTSSSRARRQYELAIKEFKAKKEQIERVKNEIARKQTHLRQLEGSLLEYMQKAKDAHKEMKLQDGKAQVEQLTTRTSKMALQSKQRYLNY